MVTFTACPCLCSSALVLKRNIICDSNVALRHCLLLACYVPNVILEISIELTPRSSRCDHVASSAADTAEKHLSAQHLKLKVALTVGSNPLGKMEGRRRDAGIDNSVEMITSHSLIIDR